MDKKELKHKIELLVDHSIPYLVVILLVLIILEFVFQEEVEPYHLYIIIADYLVIGVFCVDLVFKYLKVREIPNFLRHYWLDIIAVFPFFLLFRFFEKIYAVIKLPGLLLEPQTLFHESVILEKEGLRLIRAAEKTGKASRARLILRFIRPIQRMPRLVKIIPYFEKPTKDHHAVIKSLSKTQHQKKEK